MMKFLKSGFTLLLFTLLFSVSGQAQSGNTQNSLLPEINPQDIEIRSEFRARFPGLRRQPILGFNPKPRVFQIDPNRVPFMESRDDAVAGISVSQLSRPEPPARSYLTIPDRSSFYAKAGIGSFISPEAELYAFTRPDEKSLLSAQADLSASDGHLDNQESGFRFMDLNTTYLRNLSDQLRLEASLGGFSDSYYLFNFDNAALQNEAGKTPETDRYGLNTQITLRSVKNALEGWELNAGAAHFGHSLDAGGSQLGGDLSEQNIYADFKTYRPGSRMYETFTFSGHVEAGFYNPESYSSDSWLITGAAAEYSRLFNFSTQLTASGGISYVSDRGGTSVYLVPELSLRHNLRDAVIVSAKAYARPVVRSVQEHQQVNRFLSPDTQIQHSYIMGANAQIAFQPFGGNRVFGGLTYDYIKDYAYYLRNDAGNPGPNPGYYPYAQKFYDVGYGDAGIFEFYAGLAQQLYPEKFWLEGRIYARRPDLKDGGDIPFQERIGFTASAKWKIFDKLRVSSWAEYKGKRENPSTADQLEPYILLNGGAEFMFTDRIGVYVKVLNLFSDKYEIWDGYEERPLQFFGGITINL